MEESRNPNDTLFAPIVMVAGALMVVGVIMASSASMTLDRPLLEWQFWKTPVGRHLMLAVAAMTVMLLTVRLARYWLEASTNRQLWVAVIIWLAATGCLLAVWFTPFGVQRNGAFRWLALGSSSGGITIQPSEIAKIALVMILACWLGNSKKRTLSFWIGFLPACLAIGGLAGLIGVEDFGTAALVGGVGSMVLFAAGCRIWHLVLASVPAIAGMVYLVLAEPYRIKRLTVFRDVFADPSGGGYHAVQSLASIVSGGWLGKGLGSGLQKFGFLPEAESDFIFSVICEETGALGGMSVILLYAVFAWLGWGVVKRSTSPMERVLALGVTLLISFQATINIAVATVVAPTKGIPLPLISSGGSGLLCLSMCVGLLLAVALRAKSCNEPALASYDGVTPTSLITAT